MIYLDNSATTKVSQEVVDEMVPYLSEHWGNPSSLHALGRKSKEALIEARERVAKLLNCPSDEIYFSSCGTQSNNVALLGRARFCEANGLGRHLITSSIEHPSVHGPCQFLESNGWKVTYLPVDREGFVSLRDLEKYTTKATSIISVMWANNEIGTVQNIQELAQYASTHGIFFHTDAVQVAGKLPIDLRAVQASTLSLSGHKFHAPKGVGVLYVRKLQNLMPIIFGGGQEMGLMSGTEGIANIVAIGKAAEMARLELEENMTRLRQCSQILKDQLTGIETLRFTGPLDLERRIPGHISFVMPGVEGEAIVMRCDLKGVCVSSGSACHQGIIEPSQVLKCVGLSNEQAMGSVRISASKFSTPEECKQALQSIVTVLTTLANKTAIQSA